MNYRVSALRTVSSIASKSAKALQAAAENPTSKLNRGYKKLSRIGVGKRKIRSVQATRKQNAIDRWKRKSAETSSAANLKGMGDPKNKSKYNSQANRAKFHLAKSTASYISKLKQY